VTSKREAYRAALRDARDWDSYLSAQSGLPGPRANLELLQAAADEGTVEQFQRWLQSGDEFLAACGAVGLGRLVGDGELGLLEELRHHANNPRWRVREGVAMGLQRFGACDMAALLAAMHTWARGSLLERRAVVAGLCEPPLLRDRAAARAVLGILDGITISLLDEPNRRSEPFRVLRQALAYGWSVAVVADPEVGKPLLEKWLQSSDRDVAWLARENLRKNRLKQLDAAWVERWSR
jgi:hypothetical protein